MPDNIAVIGISLDPTGVQTGVAAVKSSVGDMNIAVNNSVTVFQNVTKQGNAFGETMKAVAGTIYVAKSALDTLGSGASFLNTFVQQGAQVDALRAKYGGLIGDYQKGNAELAKLRDFSVGSPVSYTELAKGAADLAKMTNGLGDAGAGMDRVVALTEKIAQAAPENFGEATQAVGKFFEALQTGERITFPARQLDNLHVVSGDFLEDLDKLNRKGLSAADAMGLLTKQLDLNAGNAARYASTYDGLVKMLGNAEDRVKQAFGEPLAVSLKPVVSDLTKLLVASDGPAASLGKMLGDEVRLFYGLFKNGELGSYLRAEFDAGVTYLRGKWDDFTSWAGKTWTVYISDPFSRADFGGALDQVFKNAGQYIHAAFDDGVSSFRAGLATATGDLENTLVRVFNQIPLLGGGIKESFHPSYSVLKAGFGWDDTQYPSSIFGPLGTATGKLVTNLGDFGGALSLAKAGLSDFTSAAAGANGYGASFATIGNPNAVMPLTNVIGKLTDAITGSRSYVFGTEMRRNPDGSSIPDISAQHDNFYDKNGVNHIENRNIGAYQGIDLTNPNLVGAALSPDQATALTNIADGNKALAGLMGQMIQIGYQDRTALVQVIDRAPNSNQGIELTPAAHRLVGDTKGDAPISFGIPNGMEGVEAMRARAFSATDYPLAPAGSGNLSPVDKLKQEIERAQSLLSGLGLSTQTSAQSQEYYNSAVRELNILLKDGAVTRDQYNLTLDKTQEKLIASHASYDVLAASIGKSAAAQAMLNDYLSHEQFRVNSGQAGTGESLQYGALQWMVQQGNQQQQYSKLVGGGLDALTNDAGNFFDSWRTGSQSASQAFKQFASSIFGDIAKLIERMLILQAVQSAIGFFTGNGATPYGLSLGFTSGSANIGAPASVGTNHTGGMVGFGSGSTTVSALAFVGAPRFHAGGMLGLKPGEVPIVALEGERVLNRAETQAYNRGGGGTTINQISIPLVDTSGNASKSGVLTSADLRDLQRQFQPFVDARIKAKQNARDRVAS